MLNKIVKTTDKLYETGKLKNKKFINDIGYLYKYDDSIDRYRFVLSLKNKYSFLNISDFYFFHTQKVLRKTGDDKLSDILFFFFILISSFDVDQKLDRYKYNLVKNIINDNVNIEDCYLSILDFHPVNEEDKQLFSFKRDSNGQLNVFYKKEQIDFIQIFANYLDSIKTIEKDLHKKLKKLSINFLNAMFSPASASL